MSNSAKLTLAYLEHAPAAAAKVLHEIGINDASAFLETVPARLAAPVVNNMIPAAGARCLERLAAPQSAAILRNLAYHDGASLLRLVGGGARGSKTPRLP